MNAMLKTLKDMVPVGIGLKRWLLFGLLGFLLIILGITEILDNRFFSNVYKLYFAFLILSGLFLIYISVSEGMKNFLKLVRQGMFTVDLDSREISSMVFEKRMQSRGPKIVTIGGGTGMSTMLRGLKYYSSNITAVVSVGDDGGGSGTLRTEMGILPPGDIRNCLVALANTDDTMEELMQHRFQDGSLKGQSFGNLFLAAMNGVSEDFEDAVRKMSDVLAITGTVFPVTLKDLRLTATLADGSQVKGESSIGQAATADNPIRTLSITPEDADPPEGVLEAIADAQVIILGPGSLYTSVMPNLLIQDVARAIKASDAIKIYVANIMTQPGETDGYTVNDHLKQIAAHSDLGLLDYLLFNSRPLTNRQALQSYLDQGAEEAVLNREEIEGWGITLVEEDILKVTGRQVRHDPQKLANTLMKIVVEDPRSKHPIGFMGILTSENRLLKEQLDKESAGWEQQHR